MSDKIELTEEQAIKLWGEATGDFDSTLRNWKDEDLIVIKQNPVEKAEEIIKLFQCRRLSEFELIDAVSGLRDGFNDLKKQLEEKTDA